MRHRMVPHVHVIQSLFTYRFQSNLHVYTRTYSQVVLL